MFIYISTFLWSFSNILFEEEHKKVKIYLNLSFFFFLSDFYSLLSVSCYCFYIYKLFIYNHFDLKIQIQQNPKNKKRIKKKINLENKRNKFWEVVLEEEVKLCHMLPRKKSTLKAKPNQGISEYKSIWRKTLPFNFFLLHFLQCFMHLFIYSW